MSDFPPRKRFGQHFLEPAWVTKLIDRMAPSPHDVFLEIGPGRGALTIPLAPRVARIVAVEIDRDLAARLPARVPSNVHVVRADFLDVDVGRLVASPGDPAGGPGAPAAEHDPAWSGPPVRVVGNLPYNVSSPILFKLVHAADDGRIIRDATLMLQREVADRLAARPGSREYGALAIQVALVADVERILTLPPGAFRPPPKVTSAVVRVTFRPPLADAGDRRMFERIVRGVFLQRRKTLLNALRPVAGSLGRAAGEVIDAAGLDPRSRPETLSVDDFARLSRAVL